MGRTSSTPFSPLILGNQVRRDFALHYAGEAMTALGDLLSRLEGRGRAADDIPSEDLLALLDQVTRIKGPYIHALPIPRMGAPWTEFAAATGLHPAIVETFAGLGFQRLYTHQEATIRAVLAGHNTLLSAATGRGKTEGWLIPILQRIVKDRDARLGGHARPGIKALLTYPTKALAQDQLKRLLRYLFFLNRRLAHDGVAPITIGIWDGDTPRRAADNEDYYLSKTMELIPCPLHGPDCQHLKLGYLPNGRPIPAIRYERGHRDVAFNFVYLTKDDILAEPVDILLTNPDTINWRLINVNALNELDLFVQQPRFVVFDEVHLYSSLFGAFVSALMKRYLRTRVALWERCGVERTTVESEVQFIAASATVANKVDLFRQICPVIGELAIVEEEPREIDDEWPETVPLTWADGFLDEPGIAALAQDIAPQQVGSVDQVTTEHAYEAIASAIDDPGAVPLQVLRALHATLRHEPMTAEQALVLLQDRYPDLSDEKAVHVLDNFFTIGQGAGILEDRVHLFAWPLEGLYACLECGHVHPAPTHACANPECGGRFVTQITVCRDCGQPNLEGWFCPTCRQAHPFHLTVGGERAVQEWVCPVCESEGSRIVWQPRYRCPECGWMGCDPGGPRLACPECAASLHVIGYHPEHSAVDLAVVCRREGCEAAHVGQIPERCTCGERILYYDALFSLIAVDRCGGCRRLRERLPGAPCALEGHTSRRVPVGHSLSSYVVARPGQHVVRQLREANGKVGCCSDGTPLKHRRFLGLTRSPDYLAVTLSQYLLRRIVRTGEDLHTVLCRAKLMAFSDSIRDMESLGRDFNEPEASLGLQSVIVHILEAAGSALTLADLHRRIVAWQEEGPTFATRVTDTYWGQRALANELIPGQYRAVPALPRHGIVDVRPRVDLSVLPDEAFELLAELARNNHQRQDTLRRHPAFDRGMPFLERRGLVARHVDDERGEVFVYLNPAQIEVTLVGPSRPIAHNPKRKRFATTLARQLDLTGDCIDFRVPWRKRTDLERRDVFSQLAFRLSTLPQPMRLVGQVYRGATDKVERRKLEADFRGSPRPNFLSTGPAMEVGIDIGDLNALLLFGTPPNINAYLQRVGRAGRSEKRSLVTSVSKTNPIDFYYYERPGELIASRPEPVPLNEHNEEVLRISLTWALQDWVAANFWIPWRRHQVPDVDGQSRTVIQVQDPELRVDEHPVRPPDIYRWSNVYHRPAQQIDLGGALAPLSWLVGPDSLYAPEPRRWLESILRYRFCEHCGTKFPADADESCHDERPALASDVFGDLIDDAIASFEQRLLAFLYLDVETIAQEIDALSTQLQHVGRRPSPFTRGSSRAVDPTAVFRRSEIERALERLINYKQRLERGRFAEAHAGSVEGKHAYSLRGAGDTAEVITWRPGGEDVLMREAREMAMVVIDHHPYGVFVQGNRTYVCSRMEWESLPDLWQRKDLGDVQLGACLCGMGEIDAQGVCPACNTHYVGMRKVHLYPNTARLATLPGRDRRAQPRDVHWRPTGVDASNSHAEIQARILSDGFRPQTGSAFELTVEGMCVGELAYGDLDLVVLSRKYVAYYRDGGIDPLPRPFELCGECGGVLVYEGSEPVHCLFDSGHDLSQRVQVGLMNVLRTKGLRLVTHKGLTLTHSLAHGLRLALQKIAGVDIRSLGEVVTEKAVYLYDTEPGGSGVCQLLVVQDESEQYANFAEALRVIKDRVDRCDCEVACPKCLMQYGCAVKNSLKTLARVQVSDLLIAAPSLRGL